MTYFTPSKSVGNDAAKRSDCSCTVAYLKQMETYFKHSQQTMFFVNEIFASKFQNQFSSAIFYSPSL